MLYTKFNKIFYIELNSLIVFRGPILSVGVAVK